jgi:hypothetical protein
MPNIGYIVLAHHQPEQLVRLLKRLENGAHSIFLHIDKRSKLSSFIDCEGFKNLSKIYLLKRFTCHWGDIGLVYATLEGIRCASRQKCDYVILLSGADYPIKTNEAINQFLSANDGKNFLHHFQMPAPYWIPGKQISRIKKYYYYFNNKLFEYPMPAEIKSVPRRAINAVLSLFLPRERTFPRNIVPFGGDNWFCITHAACQEIMDFYQKHPEVLRFLKFSLSPEEIFVQTAVFNSGNSALISSVINENIHDINWKSRTDASPEIFNTHDFNRLSASDKLFARKFDHSKYPDLVNRIDSELLHDPVDTTSVPPK